jgi:hypothetical protein
MKLFSYLASTLSDPNDQQGSTKRLCLFLLVLMIITLVSGVTIHDGKFPVIPESILNLIYFLVGSMVGAVSVDKGIAAYKAVKGGPGGDTSADTAG